MASTYYTYKSLIKQITPNINLSNVASQEPTKVCQSCATIVPDRRKARNGIIKISYECVDLFPDFPKLKMSAKNGCGLCRLIRKSIRAEWATQAMYESGLGTLREDDNLWDDLLDSPWDRRVRIHDFIFAPPQGYMTLSPLDATAQQTGQHGMIVSSSLQFGPATLPIPLKNTGRSRYGCISQGLDFKVFDSQGKLALLLPLFNKMSPYAKTYL